MTLRTFQMFSKPVVSITLCQQFEVISRFLIWKFKTLVQHLANLTNSEM